ncbi:hypothetical protein KEF29_27945 [Streptomyces tuirus]|uniref:Uncharacterized protein n=1 Tax=Streptomyces tuirus TaxID=68278 RepID=A0A941J2T1_9ACTN|nr:hypothetical protein [Streptomyces tuirus]
MARHLRPGGRYRNRPVSSVTGMKPAVCNRAANLALRFRVTSSPMPKIAMKSSHTTPAMMKSKDSPPARKPRTAQPTVTPRAAYPMRFSALLPVRSKLIRALSSSKASGTRGGSDTPSPALGYCAQFCAARALACGLGSGRISMVSAPLRPLLCRTSAYS